MERNAMKIFNQHVSTELSTYSHNELPFEEMERVAKHLNFCVSCRKEWEEIKLGISLAKQLRPYTCPESIWNKIEARLTDAQFQGSFPAQKDIWVSVKIWRWEIATLAVAGLIILLLPIFKLSQNSSQNNSSSSVAVAANVETSGSLSSFNLSGKALGFCPLKHTDVKAEISGFITRVNVVQEFQNPFNEKIEAVYTFPLPTNAAVDSMTMIIGDRVINGKIRKREEAQAIYENARQNGQVASLLDQERPNIFTQHVANIMPGEQIKVIISYIDTLQYEDGGYEFVFPMVVGPRYIPGSMIENGEQNLTAAQRPASLNPPTAATTRAGHDISIEVTLDSGIPLESLKAKLHDVAINQTSNHNAIIKLKRRSTIPNRDFIIKYDVAGSRIEDALLTHKEENKDGFFTMILQPPAQFSQEDVTPKELVFVLDTSGSMSGFPLEKAKEVINLALNGLYPQDTFNLITFSGDTHILFPMPVVATKENIEKARRFLYSPPERGGTEMMKAVKAALKPSDRQDHIRIVSFMTDGYVGNDMEIISEVKKHPNARVFSFGIGNSVNRFLLDKMAEYGRGEVEYVTLKDDGSSAAQRFYQRIRNPLLTDISIDWNGLPVIDIYPARIADLFSTKPIIISGRYNGYGGGLIHLRGRMAGHEYNRDIYLELPQTEPRHDVLGKLWARRRIDQLMGLDYLGIQQGNPNKEIEEEITKLGLDYGLMTQFTSFVAVEEQSESEAGEPRLIEVPAEIPSGTFTHNNGSYPMKNPTFGESYSIDGRPQRVQTIPAPSPEEVRTRGVLDYVNPLPQYEISQQSATSVLRVFERGGVGKPGVMLPSDVGSPDPDQESGDFVPVDDCWRIGFPEWDRHGDFTKADHPNVKGPLINPYRQNVLKGDYQGLPSNIGTSINRTGDRNFFVEPPPATTGVTRPGIGASVGIAGQFSVNGRRARSNNFTIDGSDNNDQDVGVRRQGFTSAIPQSIESINEFQISTLLADAEAGVIRSRIKPVSSPTSKQLLVKKRDKIKFYWNPIPGADHYEIIISTGPDFSKEGITLNDECVTGTEYHWQNLPEGKFYWRVRAIFKDGTKSDWSQVQFFQVESK
jgi:Ca-activated chloride channel homolog